MIDFDGSSVLIGNGGAIDVGWFQGKTRPEVLDMLDGFANEGEDLTTGLTDEIATKAVKAWVYSKGYEWIAGDLSSRAGTIEIQNEARKSVSPRGPVWFANKAEWWLNQFYALVPDARPASSKRPTSFSVSATFRP